MKKFILILFTLIISIMTTVACSQQPTTTTNTQPSTTTVNPSDGKTQTASPAPSTVGNVKEFNMTAKQFEFIPNTITVTKGDTVLIHLTSSDAEHGIGIPEFGINQDLPAGQIKDIKFVADKAGTFPFKCNVPCGSGHREMTGQVIVN